MTDMPFLWREDPLLKGRFHPDYPDDIQVIIHDGGPRFTESTPELVWVRVVAQVQPAYRGRLLNQPTNLRSVKMGDEFLFLPLAIANLHPIQVSEKYLRERGKWEIKPCPKCGMKELFDAPSDLMGKVFPNLKLGDEVEVFTSFCPICRGVQVIHKPGVKTD